MKHLNYILNDRPIQPEQLGIVGVPIGIVAVPFLVFLTFGAGIMDMNRLIKLNYLIRLRKKRRLRYVKCVLTSLNAEVNDYNIRLLLAA